jgi:stage V sporulation protein S
VEAAVEVLKVSSHSNPNSVAGALNQAVKAIAIARGFVAPSGVDLICVPAFADIEINGEERTAIRILVEPRDMHDRR